MCDISLTLTSSGVSRGGDERSALLNTPGSTTLTVLKRQCCGAAYLSFEDIEVDRAKNHVEPDAMKHLQRTQQPVVYIVDVSHSNDQAILEQRAA